MNIYLIVSGLIVASAVIGFKLGRAFERHYVLMFTKALIRFVAHGHSGSRRIDTEFSAMIAEERAK